MNLNWIKSQEKILNLSTYSIKKMMKSVDKFWEVGHLTIPSLVMKDSADVN